MRQMLNFDLDTLALWDIYPNKKNWQNAYKDIGRFLHKNGFEREQGSGYISVQLNGSLKAGYY